MKKTSLFVAAMASFVFTSGAAMAEKLRIGTEGGMPPFNMLDQSGKATGFDVDISYALCEKMQAECDVVLVDWDGSIPALNAKKFDFLASSMSITEERKKAVGFTNPIYTNSLQFIAPKSEDFKTDMAALKGKVIGAQRATVSGDWLEENLGKTVEVRLYDTNENAYLDLSAGRIDAILADKLLNWDWLNSDMGKDYEFKGEPVFLSDKIGIAVRKNDTQLQERLNKALDEILADGTYEKINAKYFPFSIYE